MKKNPKSTVPLRTGDNKYKSGTWSFRKLLLKEPKSKFLNNINLV